MKIRKCRMCKSEYLVPSKWPGHCSEECKKKRKSLNTQITPARELKLSKKEQERWFKLRYQVLKRDAGRCLLCGSRDRLHVDHIKPKSKYPKLEFDLNNLQTLCSMCNKGKGAWDQTDWRAR